MAGLGDILGADVVGITGLGGMGEAAGGVATEGPEALAEGVEEKFPGRLSSFTRSSIFD